MIIGCPTKQHNPLTGSSSIGQPDREAVVSFTNVRFGVAPLEEPPFLHQ